MKMSVAFRTRFRALSLLLFSLMLILALSANQTLGQGSIGVDNDGPSFVDINIEEVEEVIYVDVAIRDLNGWDNIYNISVTIMDERGDPISQVIHERYPSMDSDTMAIQWTEEVGDYLTEGYYWETAMIAPWNPDNTPNPIGLNVTFAFTKFSGNTVRIICTDKGSTPLTCEYTGPFSADYTPAPAFDNVAIPISLSSTIAVLGAIFMTMRRHRNNKLARAVEARESGEE